MLVKCKGCGNKVDRKEAFKIVIKNKNHYYCSAVEYEQINIEKESKNKVIDLTFEIIGETTNTSVYKELTDISKVHTYRKILSYMEENLAEIYHAMTNTSSSSEYGKIRYFMAILKNSLGDYIVANKENDEEILNVDIVENVVYTATKKKSFADFINEY